MKKIWAVKLLTGEIAEGEIYKQYGTRIDVDFKGIFPLSTFYIGQTHNRFFAYGETKEQAIKNHNFYWRCQIAKAKGDIRSLENKIEYCEGKLIK